MSIEDKDYKPGVTREQFLRTSAITGASALLTTCAPAIAAPQESKSFKGNPYEELITDATQKTLTSFNYAGLLTPESREFFNDRENIDWFYSDPINVIDNEEVSNSEQDREKRISDYISGEVRRKMLEANYEPFTFAWRVIDDWCDLEVKSFSSEFPEMEAAKDVISITQISEKHGEHTEYNAKPKILINSDVFRQELEFRNGFIFKKSTVTNMELVSAILREFGSALFNVIAINEMNSFGQLPDDFWEALDVNAETERRAWSTWNTAGFASIFSRTDLITNGTEYINSNLRLPRTDSDLTNVYKMVANRDPNDPDGVWHGETWMRQFEDKDNHDDLDK